MDEIINTPKIKTLSELQFPNNLDIGIIGIHAERIYIELQFPNNLDIGIMAGNNSAPAAPLQFPNNLDIGIINTKTN